MNADKEEEKAIEKHSELNSGKIERDYYLDEAMSIVIDYLTLQGAPKAPSTAGNFNN
jgi:hypothetical protein